MLASRLVVVFILGLVPKAKGILLVDPGKRAEHLALAAQYEKSVFSVHLKDITETYKWNGSCFLVARTKC